MLPWIGGPSRFSSPGRIRNSSTAKHTITVTRTKTGTDGDDAGRPRACRSCPPASSRQAGTSRSSRPIAMPIAVAMTPTTTICWTVRLRSRRGVLSSGMPAASYGSPATERNAVRYPRTRRSARAAPQAGCGAMREPSPKPSQRPARAVRRGRGAVVAAERLGELGRLAVADPVGDLADGQCRGCGASRRRAPCAPRSGARGTSCCRSRRRRAGAGGGSRRRGGRCRRG